MKTLITLSAVLATTAFVGTATAGIVPVTPTDVNQGDTNTASTTLGTGDGTITFTALQAGNPATFNANADRLGIDDFGTNASAFNDPDTTVGNANDEQLQIDLGADAGLASMSFDFTRGLIAVSGFSSDPMATIDVSGSISNFMYDSGTGTLSFFLAGGGFNGTDRTLSLDPAASQGQSLLVTINDANQAGAQLAIVGFSYENAVPEPASLGLLGLGALALIRRR